MTIKFSEFNKQTIKLGRKGENKATVLSFDVSAELQSGWTAGLVLKRPGELDSDTYPVVATLANGILSYTVNNADTAIAGKGEANLIIYGAHSEIIKSAITDTEIEDALGAVGTAPTPVQEWITAANLKLDEVDEAIEEMQETEITEAAASIDATSGTPQVSVSLSPASEEGQKISFQFTGIKGASGAAGPQGPAGATGPQGAQGATGPQGAQGNPGTNGTDGISPAVTVTTITGGHRISITDAAHQQTPITFDIMDGEDGEPGAQGTPGAKGDTGATGNGISSVTLNDNYTLTLNFTDGTSYTTSSIRGAQGAAGQDGAPGAPGAQGPQGAQGNPGTNGTDGISPAVTVTTITGGHRISITDAAHQQTPITFDIMDGEDGEPGAQGTPGAKGDTGATGNGISSVTLNDNYTLTLNFTDGTSYTTSSIRGAQGAAGQDGAPGAQGPQGAQGATGPQGAQGAQGVSGVYVGADPIPAGYNVQIDPNGGEDTHIDTLVVELAQNDGVIFLPSDAPDFEDIFDACTEGKVVIAILNDLNTGGGETYQYRLTQASRSGSYYYLHFTCTKNYVSNGEIRKFEFNLRFESGWTHALKTNTSTLLSLGNTRLLKHNGSGTITDATPGTDYVLPSSTADGLQIPYCFTVPRVNGQPDVSSWTEDDWEELYDMAENGRLVFCRYYGEQYAHSFKNSYEIAFSQTGVLENSTAFIKTLRIINSGGSIRADVLTKTLS